MDARSVVMVPHAGRRVVLVSMNRGPDDPRAYHKEALALARAGYAVAYVCNGPVKAGGAEDAVGIVGVEMPGSHLCRLLAGPARALRAAFVLQPDAVHVFDPSLVGPALRRSGRGQTRIVADLPEEYAKQILQKDYLGPLWLRKAVAAAFRHLSRRQLPHTALVVAATPTIAATLPPGCSSVVVRNYVALADVDAVAPRSLPASPAFRLAYVGGMSHIRGMRAMVIALGQLQGRAELHLAGPLYEDGLLQEAARLPGWQFCTYHGTLDWEAAIALVKACDAGLCILSPAANHVRALPVKVFEYMACSRPSIVSSFPLWRGLFAGSALFVRPDDPDALAGMIWLLLRSRRLRETLGARARSMAEGRYSWEVEQRGLIRAYDHLWGDS